MFRTGPICLCVLAALLHVSLCEKYVRTADSPRDMVRLVLSICCWASNSRALQNLLANDSWYHLTPTVPCSNTFAWTSNSTVQKYQGFPPGSQKSRCLLDERRYVFKEPQVQLTNAKLKRRVLQNGWKRANCNNNNHERVQRGDCVFNSK